MLETGCDVVCGDRAGTRCDTCKRHKGKATYLFQRHDTETGRDFGCKAAGRPFMSGTRRLTTGTGARRLVSDMTT